jgi:hypothetical protein
VKNKLLAMSMLLLTLTSIALSIEPISASPSSGPSIVVYDNINRINATLGIGSGAKMTFKGNITNVGSDQLTGLLTSVFFKEGSDSVQTSDMSFEWSLDGTTWYPIDSSEFKKADTASNYQAELIIGKAGGETLDPGESLVANIRATFNDDLGPTTGCSIAVWTFNDTSEDRHWNATEKIYSEEPPLYDSPIKIDLEIIMIRDVAITDIAVSTNATYPGWAVGINVTVANFGNATETFTVTLYYDTNVIQTKDVTSLAPKAILLLTFSWNTAGVPCYHNYTIKAVATTVPEEITTSNNVFVDGPVEVKIKFDVNGDRYVNIEDVVIVCAAFGSHPGDDNWDQNADLNNDAEINIKDIVLISIHFGAKYP